MANPLDLVPEDVGCVCQRVYGGAVRRGVPQIDVGYALQVGAKLHRRGGHVYSFDPVPLPHHLAAQQPAALPVSHELDHRVLCAGDVAAVIAAGADGGNYVVPILPGLPLGEPCGAAVIVQHLEDRCAVDSRELCRYPVDVVRDDPAMLVGRATEGRVNLLPRQCVSALDAVAAGVDVRVAGLHVLVGCDGPRRPYLQAGLGR